MIACASASVPMPVGERRSLVAARERDVGGAVEEGVDVGRVDLDLHEPCAERVAVDGSRVVDDGVVDLDDLAGDGRVELADRLRRLDLAADLAAVTVEPTAGSSTKTTSPSLSAA
jgi:hypothetical protein